MICPVCLSDLSSSLSVTRKFFLTDGSPLNIKGNFDSDDCFETQDDIINSSIYNDIDPGFSSDVCNSCKIEIEEGDSILESFICPIDQLPILVRDATGIPLDIVKFRIEHHHDPIMSVGKRIFLLNKFL